MVDSKISEFKRDCCLADREEYLKNRPTMYWNETDYNWIKMVVKDYEKYGLAKTYKNKLKYMGVYHKIYAT